MNYEYGIFYLYSIHNSNDTNKKRAPLEGTFSFIDNFLHLLRNFP